MSTLQTKHISKSFGGVHAVQGMTASFEPGKVTGLVGPNGSGKSTFINLITGMIPADSGEIAVAGAIARDMRPWDARDYGIVRSFQEVRLFEQVPVLDNVLLMLTERSVGASLIERHGPFHLKRAEEVLRQVGLWDKRHTLASGLSYGQRKLLEIARTLASEADIYLYDEPFAGLFPEMRKIVSSVIRELRAQGKVVVLIEHDMSLIRELCDHVLVMDSGKLLAEGTPDEALSKPEVIEAYLGR